MNRWRTWLGVIAVLVGVAPGCATYSDKMKGARSAVSAGDYAKGISEVDKIIGVDAPQKMPKKFGSETALAVLERATLKQATDDFGGSETDFESADKNLELLDIANDTVGEIGKYMFSDSSTKYRSSPIEKVSLNGFNMMNYLAQGNLQGSRVEARRFTVMQNYLNDTDPQRPHAAFGSYLAGFTMERLGEYGSAMRYYDEALQAQNFKSLHGPVSHLAQLTSYRGKAIKRFLSKGATSPKAPKKGADLLVLVSIGRVPHKEPKRIPIGVAIGIAGTWISGNPAVLGHTATKVVVYPELVPSQHVIEKATIRIDGRPAGLELASDLGAEISHEYSEMKPKIIGAALSRMIVRAAASEGVRQAGNQSDQAVGWIAAILTEATLVAMDKPDTRSWIFLPNRVFIHRSRVSAGEHEISVDLGRAGTRSQKVNLKADGFAVVVVTAPR
ncbi:MAG: hypothetical protein P8M78_12625 [Myxococcota bacterium]|nr:hypothetical protein [Myxococcota bacterium]